MDIINEILAYEFYDWKQKLRQTPQNPNYHAEGDVLTHTISVMENLLADNEYNILNESERKILLYAALLHDIAKPFCTKEENGEIVSPNHAVKGSIEARKLIYKYNFMEEVLGKLSFEERENICSLIQYHGLPIFFIGKHNPERKIIKASLEINLSHLSILAKADALGRKSKSVQHLLENIELFKLACEELDCMNKPRTFPSDKSRLLYFKNNDQYLYYKAFEEASFTVYLMSGIPASGKDTYIKNFLGNYPVISLDDIRRKNKISPSDNQGAIVQEARKAAKRYLAKKSSFVWNATNISLSMRTPLIDLFLDYGADIKIIYCEAPLENALNRNENRNEFVPMLAVDRMIDKLEVPKIWEANDVVYNV